VKRIYTILFCLTVVCSLKGSAQISRADSIRKSIIDSLLVVAKNNFPKNWDSVLYSNHPFYQFTNPKKLLVQKRDWFGKEHFFYIILVLFIFFAIIKNSFPRYLQDLFNLFFRTTSRQRQVKEQLMQSPLPSLLLNILYFFSGALFINLLFQYFNIGSHFNFWILLLYSIAGLAAIYIVKFITLKLSGWLFNLTTVTDAYTFIVFNTNKIIGIALLPFIVLLSFSIGVLQQFSVTLSLILVGCLFLYRYYLSFITVQSGLKINIFHFLLYLVAFEIVPLLLINKLLFKFLN
jgi:hypothetical protein